MQLKLNSIVVDLDDIRLSLQHNTMEIKNRERGGFTLHQLVQEIVQECYQTPSNEIKIQIL